MRILFAFAASLAAQPAAPMTLDRVLDEALANNLRLQAERFNLRVGDARILQASVRPNPILSLGGNYLDALGSGFYGGGFNAGPTEVNARIDFLIERGSKREERIAVAEAAKAVAELELLNNTRVLIFEVQSAFTDVLLAQGNLSLIQSSLESFSRIVTVNTARAESGSLSRVELVRSQVAALQFRNQVRQAELRLHVAKNRLQALMGRKAFAPDFAIAGSMRREPLPLAEPEILKTALANRPDLGALRRIQARTMAEVRLQLAEDKVDYAIGAGYNRQLNVGQGQRGDSLGVFLTVPLPFHSRRKGEIERARQEQSQIQARIATLEQEIAAEAANARQQYATAKTLLESIETEMLDQSTRVRDATDSSYRRGEATFVELLDAQRTFNETMQGLNEARAEYARSLYLIDAITLRPR